MTLENPRLSNELLLDQVSWIRRLARELVSDRELAEDLVQETCVVALEHRPRDASKLRGWLRSVLRNLARERRRSDSRRLLREERGARSEAQEATDRLVERVALQRELVGAVLELDEPYRSAILLRFFEELPPREIAERTGAPLATVNSRIQRALEKLRGRLDAQNRAWASLFLPLVRGLEPLGPPTFTALMNAKLTITAAVLLAAAGAYVWTRDDAAQPPSSARPVLAALLAPVEGAGGLASAPPAAESEREPLAAPEVAPASPASAPAQPEPAAFLVRGRVLDAEGQALAGVALTIDAAEPGAPLRSASDGSFAFTSTARGGRVAVAEDGWETVLAGEWRRDSAYTPVVVAAPSIELAGLVSDVEGRALGRARISLVLPDDFSARFADILEATSIERWTATSDAQGAFALVRVPAVSHSRLRTVLEGYAVQRTDAPMSSDAALAIVLERPSVPLAGALRGRVVDELGRPVGGARVACGLTSAKSDESGEFALDLARAVTAEELRAVHAGYQAAALERPGAPGPETSGWPDFVIVRLTERTLSIAGVVVDLEGRPVEGAKVWLADPTPFGILGVMPTSAENLAAGATVPPEALEYRAPSQDGDNFNDWHSSGAPPTALWNYVTTDGEGRFELAGLSPRRYRVSVLNQEPLAVHTTAPIPAGSSAEEIRMPIPATFAELRGRVVTARGAPVPNARVRTQLRTFDQTSRVFGGRAQFVMLEAGEATQTDAEGRFAFRGLPKEGTRVFVGADGIVPAEELLTPAANPEDFVIVVHTRCHVQVELEEPRDRADAFGFEDAEGDGVDVLVLRQGSTNAYTDMELSDGRSPVVSVSSEATTLLLYKEGIVVGRLPLDLFPDEVNVIRP